MNFVYSIDPYIIKLRILKRLISITSLRYFLFAWVLLAPLFVLAEHVALWDIPQVQIELQQRAADLAAEMQDLPVPGEPLQYEAYGYHSNFLPVLDLLPEEPRWTVECDFLKSKSLQKLILIPAYDRRFERSKNYGFPKRFRIVWIRAEGEETVVSEWMDEDCPDPGWAPLSIPFPEVSGKGLNRIRIEVFRGVEDGGQEYFALDEVFGVIAGDAWLAQSIQTSGALESRPYWSPDYLIDQRTSLGLPLKPARSDTSSPGITDFSSVLEVASSQTQVIELDLGQELEVGRLHFFPATPVDGVLIPNFGFPRQIDISFFKERPDGTARKRKEWSKEIGDLEPGNNVVRVPTMAAVARWIRITLHDLPQHDGRSVVGFGEIHAFYHGEPLIFKSVTLSGFPQSADALKDHLIDLEVDGRKVMLFYDWLKGLERRQQLSRELAAVNQQLTEITTRWQGFWRGLVIALVCILILCAVSVTSYTLWQRKRKEAALRERIAMDLHDDIGSRVSAMALGATYIQRLAKDAAVIEQGGKLRRLAEQMQSALSDVLWFTDSETDTLHQLLSRLESIAEQVVSTEQLELLVNDIDKMPDSKVSVMFKRDTMLIFREMVNNAAKHSGGDQVQVQFVWKKPYLTISVRDNGAGFDIAEVKSKQVDRPQLGISSMARRADRIGAKLVIESTLGQGSEIMLRIQL